MTAKKKDQSGDQTKQKMTTLRHWTAQKRFDDGLGDQAQARTHKGWEGRIGAHHALAIHFMQKSQLQGH